MTDSKNTGKAYDIHEGSLSKSGVFNMDKYLLNIDNCAVLSFIHDLDTR